MYFGGGISYLVYLGVRGGYREIEKLNYTLP
jgi:hypothetical protein